MLIDASNEIFKDVAPYLVPLDDNGNIINGIQKLETKTMVGIKCCRCSVSKLVMSQETPEHIKEKIRDLLGEDIEVELNKERGTNV